MASPMLSPLAPRLGGFDPTLSPGIPRVLQLLRDPSWWLTSMKDPESGFCSLRAASLQAAPGTAGPQQACLDGGGLACAPRDQPAGCRGITGGSGHLRGSRAPAGELSAGCKPMLQ